MTAPMSRDVDRGVRFPDDLETAIRLWRERAGYDVPREDVVALKESSKSRVYRLPLAGLTHEAVVAKRRRASAVATDLLFYREIAPQLGIAAPALLDVVDEGGFRWLFLEDLGGARYRPDDAEHRMALADWLFDLHRLDFSKYRDQLSARDGDHYREKLHATSELVETGLGHPAVDSDGREILERVRRAVGGLDARWKELEEVAALAEDRFVHGDLVAKNVLVRRHGGGLTVYPIDWETAGWGNPGPDLACWGRGRITGNASLERYEQRTAAEGTPIDGTALRRTAHLGVVYRAVAAMEWMAVRLRTDHVRKALVHLPALADVIDAASRHAGTGFVGAEG